MKLGASVARLCIAIRFVLSALVLSLCTGAWADTNPILVVDKDGRNISVLDGETFDPIKRFKTISTVHGPPQFSLDGQYVFTLSRDGQVSKYDLKSGQLAHSTKAGQLSNNIAISHDGKWLAVANAQPNTLTILSTTDLSIAETHDITGKNGTPSRVSAVHLTPPRGSFILALKDVPEIWEVFYIPNPPFYGFVHDYRVEGPPPEAEAFPMRRITTPGTLDNFYFDPTYEYITGTTGEGGVVMDLIIGLKWTDLDLPGRPNFGASATWKRGDATVMATPNSTDKTITVIDMKSWETVGHIKTDGVVSSIISNPNSPTLWAAAMGPKNTSIIHIIDKQSFKIIHVFQPSPKTNIGHIKFTQDGKFVLVSIPKADGALIAYDATTGAQVKRVPMRKPAGLYTLRGPLNQ